MHRILKLKKMVQTGYQQEKIFDRIRFDNPWWSTKVIDSYFDSMQRRMYLDKFYSLVSDMKLRRAVILMGPRRVGKTVMIFHTIQKLIADGVNPQRIIYFSVETPIYNQIALEELFSMACEMLGKSNDKNGFYVFFDEIQYLKDWEIHIKSLIDSYHNVKFVASGSAAAALKMKSIESGAGRFSDFQLPPLTFYEYIHFKKLENLIIPETINFNGNIIKVFNTIDVRLLNQAFIEYMNFGGYPEVVFSEKIQANPAQFIRNDIIDKVLFRDLPSLYGIMDVRELYSLFSVIAYHSGNEFSFENLSKISGVRKETLKKYIEYLEAAFLIKMVNKTDVNAKHFQRITSFKMYLTNTSLRCALFQPLESSDEKIGDLIETTVFAQWFPRDFSNICYANWKDGKYQGEVDIVGLNSATQKPQWATEIKWSSRFWEHAGELKSLLNFMDKNKMTDAIVTNIDKFGKKDLDRVSLHFIPTSVYSYIVSYHTVHEINPDCGL